LLSFALWRGAPQIIVELFVTQHPESLEVLDSQGRLPLHLACIRGRSPSVIDVLLEHNGLFVAVQDKSGNLPLHYAVEAACCPAEGEKPDTHLDILASLLVSYPRSVVTANNKSETPISISRRLDKRAKREVYRMLLGVNKTFNKVPGASLPFSEDFTPPTSSMFMDADQSTSYFQVDITANEMSWSDSERQAMGERPQRRNGIVILQDIPSFDSH
jgi:ankyrin repeat protein